VYRLRGNLLPLVHLDQQLGLPAPEGAEPQNIVVLTSDGTQFGLVVHDISDTQEIVVRPLSRQIKHVEAFAGATITGEGKVALILDIPGLASRATAHWKVTAASRAAEAEARIPESSAVRLLICELGDGRRAAVPMDDVARLEEFTSAKVEHAGDKLVVQYRDDLLELVDLASGLGMYGQSPFESETFPVVVHRRNDASDVGLVVSSILDVVEQDVALNPVGDRFGLLGSSVLQGVVTDVVDVHALVGGGKEMSYV
jgi:two-component system chemotaxis sensor kinase CheA